MKVEYTSNNGRIKVSLEEGNQQEVFQQLSVFQEVFEENKCGKCEGENLRFVVRNVEDNQFYELRCKDCHARLSFGSHKKGGTMFPKRKDGEGNWKGANGWTIFNRDTGKEE